MIAALKKYLYYLLSVFELLIGFENTFLIIQIFLNFADPGVKKIRLRKRGLLFNVRGAMDVWSIKEAFLDRFYEKHGYAIQPDWKVIDIGAGIGEFTLFAAAALTDPAGQVFAFEPYPGSFAILNENLSINGIKNVLTVPDAVGAETGELVLDFTGSEPLQFQSQSVKDAKEDAGIHVKSHSLMDVLQKDGLDSCDLLKLDCEGAEYAILFAAPKYVYKRIRHIVLEYHDNVTKYHHEDLVCFLRGLGYQVEIFPNIVHSYLGYIRARH